jgi:hypothetical protein
MQGQYWAQGIGTLLVVLLISTVLFLIFREVICWYWKINERLSELRQIRSTLEGIDRKLVAAGSTSGSVSGGTEVKKATNECLKCNKPLSPAARFCEYCGALIET